MTQTDGSPPGASSRWRMVLLLSAAAVVLGLAGGWAGLALGGPTDHEVGPLKTSMRVQVDTAGGTVVDVPPLGQLELATHAGPVRLLVTLRGIDASQARRILDDPKSIAGLKTQAEQDLRAELVQAVVRTAVAAVLGAALLSGLVLRTVRETLIGVGATVLALATSFGIALSTWNPAALAEPRYSGLLTSAPSVVGNAEDIVSNFSTYGDQLARIVQNTTKLYTVTSSLPLLPEQQNLVRVLHVSDLHLAPQAWSVIRTVARQYRVDVVVDSGDITDHGTRAENKYLQEIRKIKAPYVWVRGNHDSAVTEQAMRQIPNVRVLDGKIRKVAGLRFLGAGDPVFTPDKTVAPATDQEAAEVADEADRLASVAKQAGGVDVVVYHEPTDNQVFDGLASMVLSGHIHYRKIRHAPHGTWMMTEGSTGGSGLRALEPAQPAKIELSVLYVDRSTGALTAYDTITLGGLGLASAQINRHIVDLTGRDKVALPRPSATPGAPPSTSSTSGSPTPSTRQSPAPSPSPTG